MSYLYTIAPARQQPLLSSTVRSTREPHPYAISEQPLSACQKCLLYASMPIWLPLLSVLVFVRFVCFIALMILLLVPCGLATLGAPVGVPLRGIRRTVSRVAVGAIGRGCLACFGCGWGMLKVRGEYDPSSPVVVCAPHVGMTDAYVWMVLDLPRPVILEPYTKIPVVATLLRAASALPVPVPSASTMGKTPSSGKLAKVASSDAGPDAKPKSATAAVREKIIEHKRTFVPGDAPIALFPEGITHNGRTILGFFSGGFEGGSTVQPVVIQYQYKHYNGHAFLGSLPEHLMKIFANPWLSIEVDFLPAISPSAAQKADGSLLAHATRSAMASATGLPLHEMGAKDLRDEMKRKAVAAREAKQAKASNDLL